jgi:3-deoxy-manno-octulosonate cytidylyltransferase (CMP-KDO synthetase)
MSSNTILIPARFGSTRFKGKPLVDIFGKPLIIHVYDRCLKSQKADRIVVLTDHEEIVTCVKDYKGEVIMTSDQHISGTDRIIEAIHTLNIDGNIINVQGDEPLVDPLLIDEIIYALSQDNSNIVTASHCITNLVELFDFNAVKVVKNSEDFALYFSRQAIPALRDLPYRSWLDNASYYKHIGIYGYSTNTLNKIVDLPKSHLEKSESLEQLRWLENGLKIKCINTDYRSIGVDVPEDVDRIVQILQDQAFSSHYK